MYSLLKILSTFRYGKDGGEGAPNEGAQRKFPNKGKTNHKGKHPFRKDKETEVDDKSKGKPLCNINALAWHNQEAELFSMASHISQFKLAGKQITPTSHPEYTTLGNRLAVYTMAITPGTVLGTQDPFNKAIIDLFNEVRGKYTSTVPFQANDLGAVILAFANVISLIGAADRVLDHLGYVSYKTALTPELLHAAMVGDVNNATIKAGYDQDVYQAPNLKLALEVQIRRLQGLFMPKMALFDFAGWIFRHVYFEDKTGVRGDMTLFKPGYITKWSSNVPVIGASGVYASGLIYEDINSYLVSPNPHDCRIYLSAITSCIDALVQDDNVRTICGWLHQYLPDSPTVADLVQSTRVSEPDENPEMELFIPGLTIVPSANFAAKQVQQDVTKECLVFSMLPQSAMAAIDSWMINYKKQPSDDEVGLSMIFTALAKDGYVYSDPFVAVNEAIYRRDSAGNANVVNTSRAEDMGTITTTKLLQIAEGCRPTTLAYTMSSGAIASATLVAECDYQVLISPTNAFNIHYASISSLMHVNSPSRR